MLAQGPSPDRLWLNFAYTFSDFHFDNDPLFGNNELPGAPRHFLRAELLYKHPSGVFFGPNVEWVPQAYYRRQREHAGDRGLRDLGPEAGYDNGGRVLGLRRSAATSPTPPTSPAPASSTSPIPRCSCSSRAPGARSMPA